MLIIFKSVDNLLVILKKFLKLAKIALNFKNYVFCHKSLPKSRVYGILDLTIFNSKNYAKTNISTEETPAR